MVTVYKFLSIQFQLCTVKSRKYKRNKSLRLLKIKSCKRLLHCLAVVQRQSLYLREGGGLLGVFQGWITDCASRLEKSLLKHELEIIAGLNFLQYFFTFSLSIITQPVISQLDIFYLPAGYFPG